MDKKPSGKMSFPRYARLAVELLARKALARRALPFWRAWAGVLAKAAPPLASKLARKAHWALAGICAAAVFGIVSASACLSIHGADSGLGGWLMAYEAMRGQGDDRLYAIAAASCDDSGFRRAGDVWLGACQPVSGGWRVVLPMGPVAMQGRSVLSPSHPFDGMSLEYWNRRLSCAAAAGGGLACSAGHGPSSDARQWRLAFVPSKGAAFVEAPRATLAEAALVGLGMEPKDASPSAYGQWRMTHAEGDGPLMWLLGQSVQAIVGLVSVASILLALALAALSVFGVVQMILGILPMLRWTGRKAGSAIVSAAGFESVEQFRREMERRAIDEQAREVQGAKDPKRL